MFKRLVVLCALGALLPLTAHAQGPMESSFGFRAGFSSNPDQLLLGGQMSVGEVAPNLTFDPNIDLGFGDNVTIRNGTRNDPQLTEVLLLPRIR